MYLNIPIAAGSSGLRVEPGAEELVVEETEETNDEEEVDDVDSELLVVETGL
jgi:hypothetical protein